MVAAICDFSCVRSLPVKFDTVFDVRAGVEQLLHVTLVAELEKWSHDGESNVPSGEDAVFGAQSASAAPPSNSNEPSYSALFRMSRSLTLRAVLRAGSAISCWQTMLTSWLAAQMPSGILWC